jgi:DNA-binding transcriptional regulator YdaS (Cro superfamily)
MVKLTHSIHPTLQRAIDIAGGRRALARAIGCSHQNIAQWSRVPAEQVIAVEAATGLPREWLRSDIFAAPKPKHVKWPNNEKPAKRSAAA